MGKLPINLLPRPSLPDAMPAEDGSTSSGRMAWSGAQGGRRLYDLASASKDADAEAWASAIEGECHFEIFRADEERMTSTLFAGGDWRWRLMTTEGVMLAEAAGYPNEPLCRAAVLVLQRRAANAPVTRRGEAA